MKTLPELQEIITAKGLAFETLADKANWVNGFRTAEKLKGDEMKNQIEEVLQWFTLAVPEPTDSNKCVQIGCHYEEAAEMAASIGLESFSSEISGVADDFKGGYFPAHVIETLDKNAMLDSLCDQIVTAIGVAHMFGFDIVGALSEVNRSNFSKFVDGKPVFNEQGKIAKPSTYSPPVLDSFLGDAK